MVGSWLRWALLISTAVACDGKSKELASSIGIAREAVSSRPLVSEVVAQVAADITRAQDASGESVLGDLIADAQRAAVDADFAFMNPGSIRADLSFAADPTNPADVAGSVSWGELFTIQPFGNSVVRLELTGSQVVALLEQQWLGQTTPRMLQISGLSYLWDAAAPDGMKVMDVLREGLPLEPNATYSIAVNSFSAAGGDNFTVLTEATERFDGPLDLEALIDYLGTLPQPIVPPALERITRLN